MHTSDDRFDVGAFIAARPLGLFHGLIIALIALVMMVNGYDLSFIGNVLPPVSKSLGVPPSGLAGVLVMQALALAVGGFIWSIFADKFGRRPGILLSVFGFGAATFASGFCTHVPEFALARIATGLCLGGVVPNAIPIASEYAPRKYKGALVTVAFVGLSVGVVIGALASTQLASTYGWQSAFLVGGLAAAAVALICLFMLPESLAFRVQHNPSDPKIPATLRRLDPNLKLAGTEVFHIEHNAADEGAADGKFSALDLFREGRAVATVCVWAIFALSLISVNMSMLWSTTMLMSKRGLTLVQAGQFSALLVASSILAGLVYGWVLDRFGYIKVLVISYVLGIASMMSLAFVTWNTGPQIAGTVVIGATALAAQGGMVALVPLLYPTRMKATGLGWAWSFGNGVALIAPLLGGYLVARDISLLGFLAAISAPWCVIIVFLLILGRERRRLARAQRPEAGT